MDPDGGSGESGLLFGAKAVDRMTKLRTLRSLLFERGITQIGLAHRTGIPRQYIGDSILGKRAFKEEEVNKILGVLGEPKERVFPELQTQ